jgi:hypothetical protein
MTKTIEIIVIAITCLICICAIIIVCPLNSFTGYSRLSIITLSDSSFISGSFSLGSGTINEDPVFIFYSGSDKEGYYLDYRYTHDSRIFRDEEISPYLKTTYFCYDSLILKNQCHPGNYEFHVPKSTIVQQYKLDGVLK